MPNHHRMLYDDQRSTKRLSPCKARLHPPRLGQINQQGPNLDPKIVNKHLNPSVGHLRTWIGSLGPSLKLSRSFARVNSLNHHKMSEHNIIQIHNIVLWDWQYFIVYSINHSECGKHSIKCCQSHKTLLWIWTMLWRWSTELSPKKKA